MVQTLYVVKRRLCVQILYYCTECEATNEILHSHTLDHLTCHECGEILTAVDAVLEAITPTADEQ